jgi:hypothetical protein
VSTQADDFRDLGCSECGGDVDEDWTCIDCGYNPLEDDYQPEDIDLLDPADLDVLVELGPAGREALG